MVAPLTIIVGLLLTAQGLAFYFGTGTNSVTALIPAFFGAAFVLIGTVGLLASVRRHAMHLASVLALLGVVMPLGRLGSQWARHLPVKGTVAASLVLMAILCGALLLVYAKSFIDARRRRL